jgi:septum formation topological specificity factor MinE
MDATTYVVETAVVLNTDALEADLCELFEAMPVIRASVLEVVAKHTQYFKMETSVSDQMSELSRMNIDVYVREKLRTELGKALSDKAVISESTRRHDLWKEVHGEA